MKKTQWIWQLLLALLVVAPQAIGAQEGAWTKKADSPTPRAGIGIAVVGGLIYVLGGKSDGLTACPAIEVYDPATDTWTSKGTMPEPRCDLCAVTIGGKIYTLGGLGGG